MLGNRNDAPIYQSRSVWATIPLHQASVRGPKKRNYEETIPMKTVSKWLRFALPTVIALAMTSSVASAESAAQRAVDAAKKMCNG